MSNQDSILAFLARWFQRRTPAWLNPTLSFVILALMVFAGVLAWTPPAPSFAQQLTATPLPTVAIMVASTAAEPESTLTPEVKPTRTPTPIPAEWQTNEKEADGVILGAVVLVLIVVGGTLHAIRSNGE